MLANTLTLRGTNREKVTLIDLWFLDKLKSKERINVPYAVGKYLHAYASGHKPNSKLCGGHFITRIAKGLRISLKPRGVPAYSPVENDTLPIGAESYATAQILRRKGGTYVPYNPTPGEAATVSRVGTRGKRPVTVQDSDDEEEEEQEEEAAENLQPGGASGRGQSSQSGAPAYWQGFMTDFGNMRLDQDQRWEKQEEWHKDQESFMDESRYEWGTLHYKSDYLIHNQERMGHHVPDYVPTPYHHPPQWGAPGGVLPAPVYDRDASLVELQRHQEHLRSSDYHQQQQDWGPSWSSPSPAQPHTWPAPEPSNWQQQAHHHWLFGSPSPYDQQHQHQQDDPTQDPPSSGGWL